MVTNTVFNSIPIHSLKKITGMNSLVTSSGGAPGSQGAKVGETGGQGRCCCRQPEGLGTGVPQQGPAPWSGGLGCSLSPRC